MEALNGSSLSEAVSHIKVKYAGKDGEKLSMPGVMGLYGSRERLIVDVQNSRGFCPKSNWQFEVFLCFKL